MDRDQPESDWKLKLRYGKLQTPFQHYTALAEGEVVKEMEDFSCPVGKAFMGMKTWASSPDESAHMIQIIGRQIGFTVKGDIQIYEAEPTKPPKDSPYGYDITFTPFQ